MKAFQIFTLTVLFLMVFGLVASVSGQEIINPYEEPTSSNSRQEKTKAQPSLNHEKTTIVQFYMFGYPRQLAKTGELEVVITGTNLQNRFTKGTILSNINSRLKLQQSFQLELEATELKSSVARYTLKVIGTRADFNKLAAGNPDDGTGPTLILEQENGDKLQADIIQRGKRGVANQAFHKRTTEEEVTLSTTITLIDPPLDDEFASVAESGLTGVVVGETSSAATSQTSSLVALVALVGIVAITVVGLLHRKN
jgi:hypothetical protein